MGWYWELPEEKEASNYIVATLHMRLGQVQSCNVLFRLGVDNIKVFAGCRGLFTKSRPCPRRAQNLLAGCIFVGTADKSAFALLSESNKAYQPKRKGVIL